eukprot:1177189-Prorocentrum_minimum.AAC.4
MFQVCDLKAIFTRYAHKEVSYSQCTSPVSEAATVTCAGTVISHKGSQYILATTVQLVGMEDITDEEDDDESVAVTHVFGCIMLGATPAGEFCPYSYQCYDSATPNCITSGMCLSSDSLRIVTVFVCAFAGLLLCYYLPNKYDIPFPTKQDNVDNVSVLCEPVSRRTMSTSEVFQIPYLGELQRYSGILKEKRRRHVQFRCIPWPGALTTSTYQVVYPANTSDLGPVTNGSLGLDKC